MTTWEDFKKVRDLQELCKDFHLQIVRERDGYAIHADHIQYPAFVKENSLYFPPTVDEAIAWIQGLFSDGWRKAMRKRSG